MATKTQTTPSVFPRIRFAFGPKSSRMRIQPDPPESPDDTDWYLPYNGPYELPPSGPRSQSRDSWGQVIGSVLNDLGSATSPTDGGHGTGRRMAFPLPGSGAYSSHPYRASSAADTAPTTSTSRVRGGGPTPIITSSTAFAHIDTTGGVGESPAPLRRSPMQISPQSSSSSSTRLSLANLLSFGASTRKSRSDSAPSSHHRPSTKRGRNATPTPDQLQSNHSTGIDVHLPARSHSLAHDVGPPTGHTLRQRSNTLIGTSRTPAPTRQLSATSQTQRDSPLSAHPYAYAHPTSHSGAPRRAPIVSPPLTQSRSLDKGKAVDRSYQYPQPPTLDTLNVVEVPSHLRPTSRISLLKTISAPNLRNLSRGISVRKPPTPSRGKSRWLSPETWCDALLFPRPRFLEHIDGDSLHPVMAHRNVSIPVPKAHTEGLHLGRPWLRESRSAVNLHVPSDYSHGPPRAEPMLRPGAGDGWSSFSRPRSFALDDLAVPSPVPSLVRVLEMGASFERERATWRSQAERTLQSSKLTRSLGRCRSQSAGRTRAQLKDMGGVGFLATKTLMGNQLVAPTVGTPTSSEGTQTQQTRSGTSHARTLSSGGHSRAGSKGKIAVMRAATGLCISGDKMSPQDEREDPTTTRYDNVVAIGIEGQQHHLLVPTSAAAPSPSPVPTAMDSATVGIALSSPLPSTEEVATIVQQQQQQPSRSPTYARDHPYAPPPQRSHTHTRSSSDYAGPHPSAVSVTASASALASDMSARHRLPPQAVLHPYATSSALPNAAPAQQQPAALPETQPSRHRYNPERAIPHAYAAANRISTGPLAFADALSYGHQRRFSADSGLGDSEGHYEARSGPAQVLAPFPGVVLTTTPEYLRADLGRASPFLSFHTVASSSLNQPAFLSTSPDMRRSAQTSSAEEPGAGSRASSPLQSPRPFGTIEDLDRYRNLFYYPKTSVVSGSGSPSDEQQHQQHQQQHRRTFSYDTSSFAGLEARSSVGGSGSLAGGSGLAALTRQLSNEFGAGGGRWLHGGRRASDMYSNSDLNTDPDATLLPLSLHQSLHPPSEEGSFTTRIPQDVESHSHISSVLERSSVIEMEMEPVDDELLRVGTLDVASTPIEMTSSDQHLSFVCDVQRGPNHSQDSLPLATYSDDEHEHEDDASDVSSTYSADATDNDEHEHEHQHLQDDEEEGEGGSTLPSLLDVPRFLDAAPHSAKTEGTRSSFMTSDTTISGLSDFPVPPNQTVVSLDRVKDLLGKRRARAAP